MGNALGSSSPVVPSTERVPKNRNSHLSRGNASESSSPPVRSTERLRQNRNSHLSRHEQVRRLLVELLPGVVVDIIELYGARPCIVAFDCSGGRVLVFTGDWTSPPKSILMEPRLRMRLQVTTVCSVCEFLGSLVMITPGNNFRYSTIVADNQGNLDGGVISSRTCRTLVQLEGKLYTFGRSHFAVFDHHAHCFLPEVGLPTGCFGVLTVCVFKERLYLLMLTSGPRFRLSCFDIHISKCHDQGTCPSVSTAQMCANDNCIFVYGLSCYKKSSGLIVTWNPGTGFTAAERVAGDLRLITCDNEYIYFINHFNTMVLYDIASKQLIPDPAPIDVAGRLLWFDVSSKIF